VDRRRPAGSPPVPVAELALLIAAPAKRRSPAKAGLFFVEEDPKEHR
jgi:hypothetical protein